MSQDKTPDESSYETAILRVSSPVPGKPPAGLGMLVGPDQMVTCAHVVNAALDRNLLEQAEPSDTNTVHVSFPLLPGSKAIRLARVVKWVPPPQHGAGGGDIAGLRLDEDAPSGAVPALFATGRPRPGARVRVFGYPGKPPLQPGAWVDVDLKGEVAEQLIQVESRSDQTVKAQPGYSGSPVWDDSTGQAVGLLQAAPIADKPEREAYLLPPAAIAESWDEPFDYILVPDNPYRGLQPFTAADKRVFFGRDDDEERLAAMIRKQPVVVVIGPSGVGKSSLVQAGVVPALGQQRRWSVALVRPGLDPWLRLAEGLISARDGVPLKEVGQEQTESLVNRLHGEGLGFLARYLRSKNRHLLVVVDQFEELLAAGGPPDQGLIDLLLPPPDAAEEAARVVLTLRTDFLPALQSVPGVQLNGRMYFVSPLTPDQMRVAVERPAEVQGVSFDPGLAEEIVRDAAGGALPLLEFTLTRLWETQRHKKLTLENYNAMGRIAGALDQVADEQVARLTDTAADRLDQVLIRLVRVAPDGSGPATRQRILRRDVTDEEWQVLLRLADARLAIIDADPANNNKHYAELAHESLITAWRRLHDLVTENKEFLTWLARIQQRAADGDPLPEARIAEARRWLDARPDDVPEAVRRFVEGSETAAEIRLRELQDARDRAEAAREQAEAAARRSLARALSHVAETAEDPILALLLAIEVLKRSPDPQADRLVRVCLSRLGAPQIDPVSGETDEAPNRALRRLTLSDWSRGPGASKHWLLGESAADLIVDKHGQARYRVDTVIPMPGPVVAAAYSRAGVACLGTEAGELAVWHLTDRAEKAGGRDLGVPMTCIAVSETARMLAIACDDGVIRVLNGEDLSEVGRIPSPGFTRDLDLSTDRLVAALGYDRRYDRRIHVWDLVSHTPVCESVIGIDASRLAIDSSGDYVIVGDAVTGGFIGRFPLSARALTVWARQLAGRELTEAERRRYIDDPSI
ncbi:MAG: trypsin-like peptidase domain-containing protein [Streptosporangiaceae bacterium]